MTRWALFLLASYVALGLSPVGLSKATRVALLLTVIVVSGVMVKGVGG